jgi:hypothetical protein
MPEQDRTETLERLLDRQLSWVTAANERIGTPMALATGMLGVLAALSPGRACQWTCAPGAFAAASAAGLLYSLVCCSLAVFPRTKAPHDSMVYFGGIAARDRSALVESLLERSDKDHLQDLAQQVHVNAQIAATKFRWVQRAMLALLLSVPPWLVALLLLYDRS